MQATKIQAAYRHESINWVTVTRFLPRISHNAICTPILEPQIISADSSRRDLLSARDTRAIDAHRRLPIGNQLSEGMTGASITIFRIGITSPALIPALPPLYFLIIFPIGTKPGEKTNESVHSHLGKHR